MQHRIRPATAIATALTTTLVTALTLSGTALASSHREAPFITNLPKVDGSDFYMFRSYETGRAAYVTLIANYLPLQEPQGGPNYFTLDPKALYEIHVDNPTGVCRGIASLELDGQALPQGSVHVSLVDDGAIHHVRVTLG